MPGENQAEMIDPAREFPRRKLTPPAAAAPGNGAGRPAVSPKNPETSRRVRLRMMEAALQQSAEGVIIADREGRFVYWNAAAERIIGKGPMATSPAEWSTVYGCFLPDTVTPYPSEQLPLARALRGEEVREADVFIRSPDAPEGTWISVNGGPLRGEGGETAGGVVVFRDVTAHRRADDLVRQLSKAIEKTTDAVFITNAHSVIEYVNPAFEAITGYSRDQAIGRPASLLKSGWQDRAFYEQLWTSILSGRVHSATLVNRRKDGTFFHAEQTITPIPDDAGTINRFVSVMRDITELKRAQERDVEMRLARTVQQKLYPSAAPALPGFDLAGAAFPADQTCGDYYDFLPMAEGRLCIAVGDVSGHGFSAALLMAETRAYLRSLVRATVCLRATACLRDILGSLNAFLVEDTEEHRFVTLMLALVDPARKSLVYASAGHIHGYVLDGAGATRHVLPSTGPPLGLFRDGAFHPSCELPLAAGDTLLLLTDGVTEAHNREGEMFEAERALKVVSDARQESAHGVIRRLHAAVAAFASEEAQRDDVTAVVCRVLP